MDSSLCFWDAASGEQKHLLRFGPVDLWTVAFSPCNKYVISGSNEGKISMYSVETGKAEQVLDPQNGKFTLSIAYVSLKEQLQLKTIIKSKRISFLYRVPMAGTLPAAPLMALLPFLMLLRAKLPKHSKVTPCLCAVFVFRPTHKCC